MADIRGRDLRLKIEDTEGGGTYSSVARSQEDGISIVNTTEEINTKDEQGWRVLYPQGSRKAMTLTMSGVGNDDATFERLKSVAEDTSDPAANFEAIIGDGDKYAGRFQVTQFDLTGRQEGAVTFSLTLESVGTVTRSAV